MQANRYVAAILKRSYTETIYFWSVHRNWTFVAPVVTGALAMLYKSDPQILSKLVDLAKYTGISYIVAWAGTFVINLVRAPKLLHDDAVREARGVSLDPLEASREAIIKRFIGSCGTGDARGFLEWLLNNRDVQWDRIMQACADFGLSATTPQTARDLGMLALRTELHPFGWGNDMRKVLFYSVAPQFEAAIARVIYKQ